MENRGGCNQHGKLVNCDCMLCISFEWPVLEKWVDAEKTYAIVCRFSAWREKLYFQRRRSGCQDMAGSGGWHLCGSYLPGYHGLRRGLLLVSCLLSTRHVILQKTSLARLSNYRKWGSWGYWWTLRCRRWQHSPVYLIVNILEVVQRLRFCAVSSVVLLSDKALIRTSSQKLWR